MKIYVAQPKGDRESFITPRAATALEALGDVVWNETEAMPSPEQMAEQCGDAEVIVLGWGAPRMDAAYLDALPKLKLIAYMGGGISDIVSDEISKRGIFLASGNHVFAKSVAEGCLTYTLTALRRLEHYMKQARHGRWWFDEGLDNRGLIGKKVGLVGFGEIAKNYAEILRWFDVELLVASSYATEEELSRYNARKASKEEIFSTCDVVSLHSAINERTKGSITRKLMELMKPETLFVNTARGSLVDERAMVELLKKRRFCAALDVFTQEPIPVEGHFLSPLLILENVMIIPHMGGPTLDMRERVVLELAKDIKRMQSGEELQNLAIIR